MTRSYPCNYRETRLPQNKEKVSTFFQSQLRSALHQQGRFVKKPINLSFKAHLLRGVLYPPVLAFVCVIPFALAIPAAAATPAVIAGAMPTPRPRPTPAPRPQPPLPSPTPTATPTATLTPTPSATPTPTIPPTATPAPPVAQPETYIGSNSFKANWSSVSGATGYRLDVSTSSSFTSYVPGYQNRNVGNVISHSVTGLNASTTYHYRLRAYNGGGTSNNSNVINVTTLSATGPPLVITNPATLIASFSATLNGLVNPHGLTTTVYFQVRPDYQLRVYDVRSNQEWEHVPECRCKHQRPSCEHHVSFPHGSRHHRRHQVRQRQHLYHT